MARKQRNTSEEIQQFPWEPDPRDFLARFAQRPEYDARPEYDPPPESAPPAGGAPPTARHDEAGEGFDAEDEGDDDDQLSLAELDAAARRWKEFQRSAGQQYGAGRNAGQQYGAGRNAGQQNGAGRKAAQPPVPHANVVPRTAAGSSGGAGSADGIASTENAGGTDRAAEADTLGGADRAGNGGRPRAVSPRGGLLVCPHPDNIGLFTPRWYDQMEQVPRRERSWVWRGFLAHRSVTMLSSQWKAGKTTLVSLLLSRLKAGGELACQPVAAGKAVVVSEEPEELWRERGAKLGFGPHLCFICQPFVSAPTEINWRGLIERLWQLHKLDGVGLAVIDTLTGLGPAGGEANTAAAMEALRPLGSLARQGLAVLVLHHPRKGHAVAGQAARGSGALCSYVDILVEMRRPPGDNLHDRRRKLWAWSRYGETPRELLIELNTEGTDYAVSDGQSTEFAEAWAQVAEILSSPPRRLSRDEILREWPPGVRRPSKSSMWTWLERAVAEGRASRTGSGRKYDAFRYCLAGNEVAAGLDDEAEGEWENEEREGSGGRKLRNEERGTRSGAQEPDVEAGGFLGGTPDDGVDWERVRRIWAAQEEGEEIRKSKNHPGAPGQNKFE